MYLIPSAKTWSIVCVELFLQHKLGHITSLPQTRQCFPASFRVKADLYTQGPTCSVPCYFSDFIFSYSPSDSFAPVTLTSLSVWCLEKGIPFASGHLHLLYFCLEGSSPDIHVACSLTLYRCLLKSYLFSDALSGHPSPNAAVTFHTPFLLLCIYHYPT